MREHVRAKIRLMTNQDAVDFVSILNRDGTAIKYSLETFDGQSRVNARSLLGVLYFSTEHNDDTYLINESTGEDSFPAEIDRFRV